MPNPIAERAVNFLRKAETGGLDTQETVMESFTARTAPPVTGFDALPPDDRMAVEGALAKLDAPERMDPREQDVLEAIIIPDKRPVIDIHNDDYEVAEQDWVHLNGAAARAAILPAIPAIGRLDIPAHPAIPYAGTAFLVGDGLLMTNRHVAELFVAGLGRRGLVFRPGLTGQMNFAQEQGRPGDTYYEIDQALLIHPYWDMAIMRVRGLPPAVKPLTLSRAGAPPAGPAPDVVVIGYPAYDPRRNDVDVQRRVFHDLFNVKRLQPGKLLPRRGVESFGKTIEALTHDSSTLGGNSGSAVLDVASGQAVALHFGGRYLDANYGVPVADLGLDARLVDAGLKFDAGTPAPRPADGPWIRWWDTTESAGGGADSGAAPPPPPASSAGQPAASADGDASAAQAATWTVPLVITVRPGAPVAGGAADGVTISATGETLTESLVEPWHDESYQRDGYDPLFLGPEVKLPTPLEPDELATLEDGSQVIPYLHFSLAMHRPRRIALYTASNLRADPAARNPDPTKKMTRRGLTGLGDKDQEKWFTDPRLRGLDQLPDKFFTKDRKAFDKGHIVRRDDVAWGATYDELRIANGDTYHVTNCSPQTAGFNRADGVTNWGELEKAVLSQAKDQRLSVFAGPVLRDDDPVFHGVDDVGKIAVRIPQAYWKVVVSPDNGGLAAFGFLLAQDLSGVDWERLAFDAKWTPLAKSLTELEQIIGKLTFPDALHAADRHGTGATETIMAAAGYRPPR